MITTVGVDRVLTIDLHADQIQGFFDIPVDNIYATPIILEDILAHKFPDLVVVSPDVGGVVRARALAKRLNDTELAIIDKRRTGPNQAQVMHIIGDVADQNCIIVDDMVDTAGTLCQAANALKEHGAASVRAYCTHPVLSGPAIDNICASRLDELVITDSIPLRKEAVDCDRVRQLEVSALLAETMRRIHIEESVSSLFL
jgi:ribose-phosphate pyrophosphokinase